MTPPAPAITHTFPVSRAKPTELRLDSAPWISVLPGVMCSPQLSLLVASQFGPCRHRPVGLRLGNAATTVPNPIDAECRPFGRLCDDTVGQTCLRPSSFQGALEVACFFF